MQRHQKLIWFFSKLENILKITIEDNGKGFDSSLARTGIGLSIIKERVK